MRILILGGSYTLGRHAALEGIARGHQVTVFNRGTKPGPEGAVSVTGDRLVPGDYKKLDGLSFDAVIDTWTGAPEAVTNAVQALKGRIGHYTFVSTLAAHNPPQEARTKLYDESTPLFDVDNVDDNAANYSASYQYQKRSGEIAAESADAPVLVARPGLILGPYEYTFAGARLPWWLNRLHRGGPTLAPGPRDLPLQFIDARDLAAWILSAAERKLTGSYAVVGDAGVTTIGELLDRANEITGGRAELRWVEPSFMTQVGIGPWTEMPLWVPPASRLHDILYSWDVSKARKEGLRTRPWLETIKDTWDWIQSDGPLAQWPESGPKPLIGLDPAKEADALKQLA